MTLHYQPVSSSNLRAVGFQDGIGYVEFHSGARWGYEMPRKLFDEMLEAKSIGTFYAMLIKSRCKVSWTGHCCSLSPCKADATLTGEVSGNKFFLCDTHAKDSRYAGISFQSISTRGEGK